MSGNKLADLPTFEGCLCEDCVKRREASERRARGVGEHGAEGVRALEIFATAMSKLPPAEQRANVLWLYDFFIESPNRKARRELDAKLAVERAEREAHAQEYFKSQSKSN